MLSDDWRWCYSEHSASACGSKQFGLKSGVRHYVMRLEMKRAHHNGFERVGIDLDQLLSQADA